LPIVAAGGCDVQSHEEGIFAEHSFDFDDVYFYIGGLDGPRRLKYKNVQVNPNLSLVIDDLETIDP